MNDADIIDALQCDLIKISTTVERLEDQLAVAKAKVLEADQHVERMRTAIANVVSAAHVVQRIAAGEKG